MFKVYITENQLHFNFRNYKFWECFCMTRPGIYDKLMKGYLKSSHIKNILLNTNYFPNVCMNTSSMCTANDMNTCTVCDTVHILST